MENVNHSTPTRTPHNRSRSALGEVTLSASRLNLPSPVSNEKYRATTTAANRLIDFNRGTSHTPIHNRSLSTASGPRHRRQLSKAARYHFLQRVATSDKESTSDSDSLTSTEYHVDLGDSNNAIIHFRPQLWKHLDPTRDTLNLDLFWPQRFDELDEQEEDSDDDIYGKHVLPLEGLLPMCQFRNLRALQLGGMLQSYQTYIWRTCWLNPGLEEVILEMALEPTMNESYKNWVPINGAWTRKTISGACTDYLGEQQDGTLSEVLGIGEYLDKNAMATARNLVSSQGVNLRYLPIVKLVLAGFVVDAGPFFRWFNPMRLRQVEFKHGCIDAGFALPSHMSNLVTVCWPLKPPEEGNTVTISRIGRQDIKTIWLKKKNSTTGQAIGGLKPKISSMLSRKWFSSERGHGLKARKAEKERQQRAGQKSQASSSSDLSLFRHRSSSGTSLASQEIVA